MEVSERKKPSCDLEAGDMEDTASKQRWSSDQPPDLRMVHTPFPARFNRRTSVLFSSKKQQLRVDTSEPKCIPSRGSPCPLELFPEDLKRWSSMKEASEPEISPPSRRAVWKMEPRIVKPPEDGSARLANCDSCKINRSHTASSSSETDSTPKLSFGEDSENNSDSASSQYDSFSDHPCTLQASPGATVSDDMSRSSKRPRHDEEERITMVNQGYERLRKAVGPEIEGLKTHVLLKAADVIKNLEEEDQKQCSVLQSLKETNDELRAKRLALIVQSSGTWNPFEVTDLSDLMASHSQLKMPKMETDVAEEPGWTTQDQSLHDGSVLKQEAGSKATGRKPLTPSGKVVISQERKDRLLKYLRDLQNEVSDFPLICKICDDGKMFTARSALFDHYESHAAHALTMLDRCERNPPDVGSLLMRQ